MNCPWEMWDKEAGVWIRCTEEWPHFHRGHHIGSFILSTEALKRLRHKGLAIVRRHW